MNLRLFRVLLVAGGLLLGGLAATGQPARPVLKPDAAATDCAACHGSTQALPAAHKAVVGMKWTRCLECHERHTEDSLAGRVSGSHAHQLAGVACKDCHGEGRPQADVDTARCLSCHESGDKVAARTAATKPRNPHNGVHYGSTLDCDMCHGMHRKSVDYCAECHRFGFQVP